MGEVADIVGEKGAVVVMTVEQYEMLRYYAWKEQNAWGLDSNMKEAFGPEWVVK